MSSGVLSTRIRTMYESGGAVGEKATVLRLAVEQGVRPAPRFSLWPGLNRLLLPRHLALGNPLPALQVLQGGC